jgi:hypothetical protein
MQTNNIIAPVTQPTVDSCAGGRREAERRVEDLCRHDQTQPSPETDLLPVSLSKRCRSE